jgi:hypothetical protein
MKGNLINTDVFQIKLATNQLPKITVDKFKKIIKYGSKNDHPDYQLWLLENHAEHGAIVKGKATYLTGLSIIPEVEDQRVKDFLDHANPLEDWHTLDYKLDIDKVNHGGYYVKVVTNALGTPMEFYHVEFNKVRIKEDFQNFEICDDWSDIRAERICLPIYRDGLVGTSLYYYKRYSPSKNRIEGAYPKPEWLSCTLDIDTDIRVSSFFNSYVKNNFSAGTLITIFGKENADPKAKEDLVNRLKANHTGEDTAGNVMVAFTAKDGKGAEVLTLNSSDLDKQYQELSKRNKEKIIAGHNVTGVLFKIKTDDKALFARNEIIEAHELFINEYVKPNQVERCKLLSKFCKLKTGIETKFEIEQIKPIGRDLSDPNLREMFTEDEIRDSMGYKPKELITNPAASSKNDALNALSPLVATKVLETMTEDEIRSLAGLGSKNPPVLDANGTPIQEAQVNSNLKSLTGREYQNLMRIVRNYDKGKLSKEQALLMIKSGFQMSEAEALEFLGIAEEDGMPTQLSAHDKSHLFLSLFDKYAHDINEEDELLEAVSLNFKDEFTPDLKVGDPNSLRNAILNQLKGNPYLSVEEIAKNFKVDKTVVRKELDWLEGKKLIDTSQGTIVPTEKAFDIDTETIKTEIYTEYRYELRDDLKGEPTLLPTSRDFCRDMVEKTKKKALTFEAIDKLQNDFGENAFDFRGGWYNDGTKNTPWCRHVWKAYTKIRRVKK